MYKMSCINKLLTYLSTIAILAFFKSLDYQIFSQQVIMRTVLALGIPIFSIVAICSHYLNVPVPPEMSEPWLYRAAMGVNRAAADAVSHRLMITSWNGNPSLISGPLQGQSKDAPPPLPFPNTKHAHIFCGLVHYTNSQVAGDLRCHNAHVTSL